MGNFNHEFQDSKQIYSFFRSSELRGQRNYFNGRIQFHKLSFNIDYNYARRTLEKE